MLTIALAAGSDAPEERQVLCTAAALAVEAGARLVTVHALAPGEEGFVSPDVAGLAERWHRSIDHVPMIHECCDDVTDTLLDALRRLQPSLVVAGTHARSGWAQLVSGSVAEGVARNVPVPTLLVPIGGRDLVDSRSGTLAVRRVLVPAGDRAAAEAGLRAAAWLVELMGAREVECVLLHVDDGTPMPDVTAPAGLRIERRSVRGELEAAIAETAAAVDACVVVMATHGHDGILDAALGSRTERVLRRVGRPLLSVPL